MTEYCGYPVGECILDYNKLVSEKEELIQALEGVISEFNRFSQYGSPIARAANQRIEFANEVLKRVKT